jgi:uncharacterized membrane protein YdjX (TVP38/TMEM64 family)
VPDPTPSGQESTPPPAAPAPDAAPAGLGAAGVLGVLALALPPVSGGLLMTYMRTVSEWLRSHHDAGLAIYIGLFALCAGLALLPTYAQSALGGYAFGTALGVPAALAGFALAAVIGYEIGRLASGDRVERALARKPRWQAVRDALVRDHEARGFVKTTGMVALLRFPPNSPFALVNLLMASVKVPRGPYLLGTIIGMAPRTAVAVAIGATVKEFTTAELSKAMPLWLWIAGIAVMLVVLVVVGVIAERAIARLGPAPAEDGPPAT